MVRKGLKKGGKITEEREEGLFKQNSSLYSNLPKEFPTRGMLLYSLHTSWVLRSYCDIWWGICVYRNMTVSDYWIETVEV